LTVEIVLLAMIALFVGLRRPDALESAGAALGGVDDIEAEPELALGV